MGGFNRISVVKASSNHDTVLRSLSPSERGGQDDGHGRRLEHGELGEGECPRGNTRFIAGVKRRNPVWNSDLGKARPDEVGKGKGR